MQSILRETHRVSISISCIMLMFLGSASDSCAENSTIVIPKKYVSAVIKCEQRLKLAPDNLALRKTLAGHYIKIAQSLKSDPYEAVKFLHKADLLEPGKPCGPMHEQLGDIYRVRDENDKAVEQYIKAQSFGDSKGLDVKLGQAYQAKKDIVSAVAAYAKASTMKSDDPLEQEALVAGWEEALKPVLHQDATMPLDSSAQYQLDFVDLSNDIKSAWLPPKRADFKTAKLSAKFFANNGIADLRIVSSSGDSSFDRSAVRALERLEKNGHGLVLPAALADGSTLSVEFQHIIGGPKIVLVTL